MIWKDFPFHWPFVWNFITTYASRGAFLFQCGDDTDDDLNTCLGIFHARLVRLYGDYSWRRYMKDTVLPTFYPMSYYRPQCFAYLNHVQCSRYSWSVENFAFYVTVKSDYKLLEDYPMPRAAVWNIPWQNTGMVLGWSLRDLGYMWLLIEFSYWNGPLLSDYVWSGLEIIWIGEYLIRVWPWKRS